MLALDHAIFGNGWGMKSPYFDNVFYWLKDHKTGRSELYTFNGWFGAQLRSCQWTHPRAGERRELCKRTFQVMHSSRRWLRVEVSWCMVDMPQGIDASNAAIRELQRDLSEARG